jgi:hypothetical protein
MGVLELILEPVADCLFELLCAAIVNLFRCLFRSLRRIKVQLRPAAAPH